MDEPISGKPIIRIVQIEILKRSDEHSTMMAVDHEGRLWFRDVQRDNASGKYTEQWVLQFGPQVKDLLHAYGLPPQE